MLAFSSVLVIGSTIACLFVPGVCLRNCLLVVTVTLTSMAPTLQHGDRVLVVRYWPRRWLRKGQIVVVQPWHTSAARPVPFTRMPYVKRIVALSGEIFHDTSATDPHTSQTWNVPEGHVFVCGDNRQFSVDSRTLGPLPLKNVLGVVLLKLPRKASPAAIGTLLPSDGTLTRQSATPGLQVGLDAPDFTAQTLDGTHASLCTFNGNAVLLLFFAPSPFCSVIMPDLLDLMPRATSVDIKVVFVSSTSLEPTRAFVAQHRIAVPVLLAPRSTNRFFADYHVSVTPAYCLIDKQGKILATGYINREEQTWQALADNWM